MSLQTIISETFDKVKLDQITFAQIIKVLNISIDNPRDPNIVKILQEKFKSQLLSIFQSEGRNYKDYLTLPKFVVLKPSTREKMFFLFNEIWDQYSKKMGFENSQGRNENIEQLIPDFRGIQQIQTFHLELLKSFKSSKLCKQNQVEYKSNPVSIGQSGLQQIPFQRPRNPPIYMMEAHQNFMNLPSNPNNIYPKVQEDLKVMSSVWQDRKYLHQHPSSFPIPRMPDVQNGSNTYNKRQDIGNFQKPNFTSNPSRSYPVQDDSQMIDQIENQEQNKQYLTGSQDQFLSKVHQYMFSECACEGNLKKTDAFFVCKQCQYYYHFQCLHLNESPTAEMCPCCKLKNGSNLFLKIHPQAYGKRWCRNFKEQKLSMSLTQKQIERMRIEKNNIKASSQLEYQLRFLKITTRRSQNVNGRRVVSQNSRKFNSLPLPASYVEKIQPYNVFDISLKPADQNDKSSQCTYFFAIFIAEKFSQATLTDELFSNLTQQNSVGQQFLQRYLGDQQQITIKMKDPILQQKILFPARGDQCDHAQVFDYMSILQYYREWGQKLKGQDCSICSLPINRMIADRFLLGKINQYYEENQDKEIQFIKYMGRGEVQYLMEEEESMSESEGSNEQDDSGSLST